MLLEQSFKRFQARLNRLLGGEVRGDSVRGLQAISCDANDSCSSAPDPPLFDHLRGHARRYAASGFTENSFGFRKQLDGLDDFGVGEIFGPAAGFANQTKCE